MVIELTKEYMMLKTDLQKKSVVAIAKDISIEENIRQRAYELFQARGGEEGHDLEDWLRAEEEIRGAKNIATAA